MNAASMEPRTVAEWVAEFLVARGVDRIFGLQGGHIQPIWDHLARRGVRIVDVRDEGAAVHMAHAHAVLTGGVGIALVTAGPGVTNCVTAIANAQLERVPVLLIGGCAPVPQDDLGPLQGIDHVAIMRPVTRSARTLRVADNLLRDLDKALVHCARRRQSAGAGVRGDPDRRAARDGARRGWRSTSISRRGRRAAYPARPGGGRAAAALIARGKRRWSSPGAARSTARRRAHRVARCQRRAVPRHAGKPRLVPAAHPAVVGAVRARAMQEADLVDRRRPQARLPDRLRLAGRVRPNARLLRIADNAEELRENRRGEVELLAHPAAALAALARRIARPSVRASTPRGARRCATST